MKRLYCLSLFAALLLAPQLNAQVRRPPTAGGSSKIEETTRIINDCESRTNKFKKTLDKALGRDNVKAGQAREDQLNRNAERLENEMDKVGDSWNRDHNMDKTRTHVRAAITAANDINQAMRTWNMGGDAEQEWAAVRSELNRLATTFNVAHIR